MPIDTLEGYCNRMGYELARKIDDSMGIAIKPKPWWMPRFLYEAVIRKSVEIINIKK